MYNVYAFLNYKLYCELFKEIKYISFNILELSLPLHLAGRITASLIESVFYDRPEMIYRR